MVLGYAQRIDAITRVLVNSISSEIAHQHELWLFDLDQSCCFGSGLHLHSSADLCCVQRVFKAEQLTLCGNLVVAFDDTSNISTIGSLLRISPMRQRCSQRIYELNQIGHTQRNTSRERKETVNLCVLFRFVSAVFNFSRVLALVRWSLSGCGSCLDCLSQWMWLLLDSLSLSC